MDKESAMHALSDAKAPQGTATRYMITNVLRIAVVYLVAEVQNLPFVPSAMSSHGKMGAKEVCGSL
jgi:hypothetical protein